MKYIIGVDAGGTKTEVASYNLHGEQLDNVIKGPGNITEDFINTTLRIKDGIKEIKAKNKKAICDLIVIGVAGLESSGKRKKLHDELQEEFSERIELMNDGKLAHYAILKGKDGEIVISGTGSVIFSKKDQIWSIFGGWGPILGDEGSGYSIGVSLLKNCLNEFDIDEQASSLSLAVLKKIKCEDIRKLPKKVKIMSKVEIASLSKVLADMPYNDVKASNIIKENANKLAWQYIEFYQKENKKGVVNIGINGGVFVNNSLFRKFFFKKLKENKIKTNVFFPESSISKGAYYVYMEELLSKGDTI